MSVPEVSQAVGTLEKRLRRAQIQRIILLWFTVVSFALTGFLFYRVHDTQVEACQRGSEAAADRAVIAERVGAHELARRAGARAKLDCGQVTAWF